MQVAERRSRQGYRSSSKRRTNFTFCSLPSPAFSIFAGIFLYFSSRFLSSSVLGGDVQSNQTATREDAFVTFIVPTSGRSSLGRTLRSIERQEDGSWKVIIVYSSSLRASSSMSTPPYVHVEGQYLRSEKFTFITFEHHTRSNCGGSTRNYAIKFVTTPWVAFVDDDDTISPAYVSTLRSAMRTYSRLDLLAFRMFDIRKSDKNVAHRIVPEPHINDARLNHIGISFAFRKTNTERDIFVDSSAEDYFFIHKFCYRTRFVCMLSRDVMYFVKATSLPQFDKRQSHFYEWSKIRALPHKNFDLDFLYAKAKCFSKQNDNQPPQVPFKVVSGESTLPFFKHRILSLRQSLHDAWLDGCWPKNDEKALSITFTLSECLDTPLHGGQAEVLIIDGFPRFCLGEQEERQAINKYILVSTTHDKTYIESFSKNQTTVRVISPWPLVQLGRGRESYEICSEEGNSLTRDSVMVFTSCGNAKTDALYRTLCGVSIPSVTCSCLENLTEELVCSTAVISFHSDTEYIPWTLVEQLILAKKIVGVSPADRIDVFHRELIYGLDIETYGWRQLEVLKTKEVKSTLGDLKKWSATYLQDKIGSFEAYLRLCTALDSVR